jgi:hypothetical protein
MKAIMSFTLASFILAGAAYAKPLPQENPVATISPKKMADAFGAFHVHRQGDYASLNWNVVTGNVLLFNIERSYDGEFFELIAIVTPESTRWNRYVDKTVEPGVIYYRIIAVMNDGADEWSTTESVKIVKHK